MEQKHQSKRSENFLTPSERPWRVAFLYLHEKRTKDINGALLAKPFHELTVAMPKLNADPAHCDNYKYLSRFVMDAATKAWGAWPQGGHWPIKDGDAPPQPKIAVPGQPVQPVDPKSWEWRKGHWYFKASNYSETGPRIAIRDATGGIQELPARTFNGKTWYKSGDFAVLQLSAYSYHNKQFGVNLGFDGVLFVGEGDSIGSSGPKSAAAMFAGVAGPTNLPNPSHPNAPGSAMGPPPASGYAPVPVPAPGMGAPPPGSYGTGTPALPPLPGAPVAAGGPPMPPGFNAPPPLPAFPAR